MIHGTGTCVGWDNTCDCIYYRGGACNPNTWDGIRICKYVEWFMQLYYVGRYTRNLQCVLACTREGSIKLGGCIKNTAIILSDTAAASSLPYR